MVNKTEKQKIGDLGEGIACDYLKAKGHQIIERNYWKPWGEIDIIVEKEGVVGFIEVKTVSRENLGEGDTVARETDNLAENMDKVSKRYVRSYKNDLISNLKTNLFLKYQVDFKNPKPVVNDDSLKTYYESNKNKYMTQESYDIYHLEMITLLN